MPDLRPLVGYIIDQVVDQGGSVNKTALVKLVYLVDLEHYRRFGKLVTDLPWRFHHYGPYATELETAINDNAFVNVFGNRQSFYRFSTSGDWREIQKSFNAQFEQPVKRVVDSVVDKWGLESLNSILDFVYFETEPMENVERGDVLDFSSVARVDTTFSRPVETKLPEERLEELRTMWNKSEEERRNRAPAKPLQVPYDDVTAEAFQRMAEDERPSFELPFRVRLRLTDSGDES